MGTTQQWMWLNDSLQYQAYDGNTCVLLSTAYNRDSSGTSVLHHNQWNAI